MADKEAKGLTPRGVETKTEPGRYFDANRTGLFLTVAKTGTKRWGQRIVIRGKRCEIGLGGFPVVSLAAARRIALDNLRAVAEGRDPLTEKREARAVLTFEETARKVHEIYRPTWRNEKHAADFLNSLTLYAFPRIGSRK
ncbi:MAG: DUF4102 domain-containing protein, partial [Paracoccaceae bacterium]|nr:DUF4102 domain-containing protein [Paracoccaceae bacterium]